MNISYRIIRVGPKFQIQEKKFGLWWTLESTYTLFSAQRVLDQTIERRKQKAADQRRGTEVVEVRNVDV